jgi:chromosome segregation ATPase
VPRFGSKWDSINNGNKKKSDVLAEASREIKTQSQMLKRELDNEIHKKLVQKIKLLEQTLNNIKNGVVNIKTDNEHLYTDAGSRLEELNKAISLFEEMTESIKMIRNEADYMGKQCTEIKAKIEHTATKISTSMTSLNQLIDSKQTETKSVTKDIRKLKKEMAKQQTKLQSEMESNQTKIEADLNQLDKKLLKALENAKIESSNKSCTLL